MADYHVYIEADSTASDGVVTGSGTEVDPYVGRGDDVMVYVVENVLVTWGAGAGGNPAWADGDRHIVHASNKEVYEWLDSAKDNNAFSAAWLAGDNDLRSFSIQSWETTTEAAGGTFITWPSGEKTACATLDGTLSAAQKPFKFSTSSPVTLRNLKLTQFDVFGFDGTVSYLEDCEFSESDTAALDGNTGTIVSRCWFHDGQDSSSIVGPEGSNQVLNSLLEGAGNYLMQGNNSMSVIGNVFRMDSSNSAAINMDGNFDEGLITGNIFIGAVDATGQYAIDFGGATVASDIVITGNLFVNFNGSGSCPIHETAGNGENQLLGLNWNFYYNCNDNEVQSVIDAYNEIVLSRNPLYNPGGGDYRLILDAELRSPFNRLHSGPFVSFAPWGMIDVTPSCIQAGGCRIEDFVTLPTDGL